MHAVYYTFVVANFALSESDYRGVEEDNATIQIRITRDDDVLLATPVWLRITPLTVQEALDRNITSDYEPDNPVSPRRASK